VTANSSIKRTAIVRAGYEYQDLVGIEILIDHFRDPDLYEWVQLESDDPSIRALDDVVALRKDGSIEFLQVKFTVDAEQYFLDWDWLLGVKGSGSSMLSKWMDSFLRAKSLGKVHRARLMTNRVPSESFSKILDGEFVDLGKLPEELRARVESECGSKERAQEFFREFSFASNQPDWDRYENMLRDRLVPNDTDASGWLLLRDFARRWATFKNEPPPDGKIHREHLVQLITKRRPQPISQDFVVPLGYQVPSRSFDEATRKRIENAQTPITILWGTPGRGKSTYLSNLTQELQREDELVLRHHYFLSSDGPRSNRMSYVEIATSIIDQLISRYPDVTAGVMQDPERLHADLAAAAANLAEKGKRLFLVIDGLDHVWRDISRTDQLDYLFNVLLPLPANVSLIVGTQRVPDAQLPAKLLTIAGDGDWMEVPRMDESAVHRWLESQDAARPLIIQVRNHEDRAVQLAGISASLFQVSQGHPLHLIYALESLVRTGKTIDSDDIASLPACPDGDIRTYYKALWVRLSVTARNVLHALAGSDFFWPSIGIREALGDFNEIDFLLEPRNAGMIPFHQSIFAYVRELPDHSESYAALLPQIVRWLETQAPEYWRWGWLWLAQAETGNYRPLLDGAQRDWVVASLAKGWPERQIARILSVAEVRTFEQGDFPQTVKLRSLKTRVRNAREFQSADYGLFRATALTISGNRQQALNLIDDLQELSAEEIVALAKQTPIAVRAEVAAASLQELGRRVNAWIELRHKPEHEFRNLSDRLLSAAAFAGPSVVPRILRYLSGYRNPAPHCNTYIDLLGSAQDIQALLAVRKRMRGQKCGHQRRLIQEHILRASLFKGANPENLIKVVATDLTPFTAAWAVKAGVAAAIGYHASPPPKNLLSDRYSVGSNPGLSRYFRNFFWTALCVSLQAQGDFSLVYPSRDSNQLGWLENALWCLEDVARGIALGRQPATFSAIYQAADALETLHHVGPNDRNGAQYRAFRHCLPDIALELHLFGLTDRHQPQIPAAEFNHARATRHWLDELWIEQNVSSQLPLLEKVAADKFIQDAVTTLSSRVSEFNERSGQWTKLALIASFYGVQDPSTLIERAADCLVGYGWRKDLGALDVLDAIRQVHKLDPSRADAWISAISPIIEEITDFTDGDETDHVRSDLIGTVEAIKPEYLPAFYTRHISNDEWRYADETLGFALGVIDFSSKESAALAGTLLDDNMLAALEKRANNEPSIRPLLQKQIDFLARPRRQPTGRKEPDEEDLRPEQREATRQDPTAFGPRDFTELVGLIASVNLPYHNRGEFLATWLDHWRARGKASVALNSVRDYFNQKPNYYAEEILDEAFKVSLAEEGKHAAYPWLVKAHIYRHGWQGYWTSEEEVVARLTLAAQTYPERWRDFIRDTSEPTPYYRRRSYDFSLGYKYLVRFLMLVGQEKIALAVTDEFVRTFVCEVRDQPIASASWISTSTIGELPLKLLFQRLNWPVPMVRWRAAKGIRDLLNDAETRKAASSALLSALASCQTESDTCSLLNIILLSDPHARPPLTDVASRVNRPSVLSAALLYQIYGATADSQLLQGSHSGHAPEDFEADVYFEKHKSAHVPPVLFNNLRRLQDITGMPFLRQWAFEWKQLHAQFKTRFTEYPYYFDDVSEVRGGIVGQYLQRQAEIYRSAYLRVFSYALEQWGMPEKTAAEYCFDNVPAIAGLFELGPAERPAWLANIPERALMQNSDLEEIARELVKSSQKGTQRMVSLHTPFAADAALYGHLSISAYFVTDDFQLRDDRDLYEPTEMIVLRDSFNLQGQTLSQSVGDLGQKGASGRALPVCVSLLPIPFGYWQGDYFSAGLTVPARYCLQSDAVLRVNPSEIGIARGSSLIASTQVWHDAWSPRYPREGSTRCGIVTLLEQSQLFNAQAALGLRLAWFIQTWVWTRSSDNGDFKLKKNRAIVIER